MGAWPNEKWEGIFQKSSILTLSKIQKLEYGRYQNHQEEVQLHNNAENSKAHVFRQTEQYPRKKNDL